MKGLIGVVEDYPSLRIAFGKQLARFGCDGEFFADILEVVASRRNTLTADSRQIIVHLKSQMLTQEVYKLITEQLQALAGCKLLLLVQDQELKRFLEQLPLQNTRIEYIDWFWEIQKLPN